MEIEGEEIRKILKHPAFVAVVGLVESSLTRKVMSPQTADDEVPGLRAEHRALQRILSTMASLAAPGENEDE